MTRKQPLSFEKFQEIYSTVPRLCVDLIIKGGNGYLLTLRQKNGYVNKWHWPGGTVFYKEKIVDAVKRVTDEELGIEVKIIKLLGYLEYPSEIIERGFGYSVSLVFLCDTKASEFRLDDQVEKANYFMTAPENMIDEQKEFMKDMWN